MRSTLLILTVFFFCQPEVLSGVDGLAKGRILSSMSNDRDTIDFGYNLSGNEGAFIYRSLYFVNDGDESLVVRDSDIVIDTVAPTNASFDFTYPVPPPLVIDPQFNFSNPFRYDSIRCVATIALDRAPEGINRLRMRVRLAYPRAAQADSTVALRSFILQYIKTVRPLWANAIVNFDSVYVGGVKDDSIQFRNSDLKRTLRVEDSSSTSLSGIRGNFVFRDSPIQRQLPIDSGAKALGIRVRYTASQRGLDSVRMMFEHFNPSSLRQGQDSTPVVLRGVGVEQDMRLSNVLSLRGSLHGDTVDVGSFTVGVSDTVRIVFNNRGNISYRARMTMTAISPADSIPFSVIDSLSSRLASVQPDQSDTMVVVFQPTRVGDVLSRCVLRSDIDSRVFAVPQDQLNKVFYLRGQARPQLVTAFTPAMRFDSVAVFDACPVSRSLNVRVHNSSTQDATVRVQSIIPADAPFTVEPAELLINAGEEKVFRLVFSPRTVEAFSAQLLLRSTIDDAPLRISIQGKGVEPRKMMLSLPSDLRSFPGNLVTIPLLVDASLISQAQTFTMRMSFDSSLLRFHHYDKVGTASAGADLVEVIDHVPGELQLQIHMPSTFQAKDTLLRLVFRSSLGYQERCDVSISSPAFGLDTCTSVMPSSVPSTVFSLDSLCGLQSKLMRGPLQEFRLGTPSPNPAQSATEIVYSVAFPTSVRIVILNSVGTVVQTVTNAAHDRGVYRTRARLDELSDGVYYVHMSAAMYEGMERIVHSR